MMAYQIFLVEDHPAVREAYVSVLATYDDFAVCGEASSAEDAMAALAAGPSCDLVITDVRLPGISGIDLVGHLRRALPDLPTLVVSGHEGETIERRALEAGATAFLAKRDAASGLVRAIRSVLRG